MTWNEVLSCANSTNTHLLQERASGTYQLYGNYVYFTQTFGSSPQSSTNTWRYDISFNGSNNLILFHPDVTIVANKVYPYLWDNTLIVRDGYFLRNGVAIDFDNFVY